MAKQLVRWIKNAVVNAIDPGRQERIEALSAHLYSGLRKQRKKFNLAASLGDADLADSEINQAKENVLARILDKVWDDGVVTDKERATVDWVQEALEMSAEDATRVRHKYATDHFQMALAKALEDGHLSDDEVAHLNHIASTVGETISSFARRFFKKQGESLYEVSSLLHLRTGL